MHYAKLFIAGSLAGLSACAPFALAPGAADVRITKLPADVAGCAPVGNIRAPTNSNGVVDIVHAVGQLKNQTIGLGGNVAFVTEGTPNFPEAGVAYQCPVRPVAGT